MSIMDTAKNIVHKMKTMPAVSSAFEAGHDDFGLQHEKPKKIRGKALTRYQRKRLIMNGMSEDEIELYLLKKITISQEGSDKNLHHSRNKVEKWTLIHRETGKTEEVYLA